jgi:PTS system mannose-specific IIA component
MSVGVLLMTHEAVGKAIISAAHHVMPNLPLRVAAVEVPPSADPDVMRTLTAHHARDIGMSLGALGIHLRCVSGLNLPMLLRVLNYAEKPLDELAEIAASGGRGGIFIDHA